jgi:hypothetical protein
MSTASRKLSQYPTGSAMYISPRKALEARAFPLDARAHWEIQRMYRKAKRAAHET